MWKFLTRKRSFKLPHWHDLVHRGEHFTHMAYLGLVSIESKYIYGKIAGIGFVLMVVGLFIHEDEDA